MCSKYYVRPYNYVVYTLKFRDEDPMAYAGLNFKLSLLTTLDSKTDNRKKGQR